MDQAVCFQSGSSPVTFEFSRARNSTVRLAFGRGCKRDLVELVIVPIDIVSVELRGVGCFGPGRDEFIEFSRNAGAQTEDTVGCVILLHVLPSLVPSVQTGSVLGFSEIGPGRMTASNPIPSGIGAGVGAKAQRDGAT